MDTDGHLNNESRRFSFHIFEEILQDIYIAYRNYQRITRTGVLPAPHENQEVQCMFKNPVYNKHPKSLSAKRIFYHITLNMLILMVLLIKSVKLLHKLI